VVPERAAQHGAPDACAPPQVHQQLRGLVLLRAELPRAWERTCRLAFGPRLGQAASHHVYLEVQGRRGPARAPRLAPLWQGAAS